MKKKTLVSKYSQNKPYVNYQSSMVTPTAIEPRLVQKFPPPNPPTPLGSLGSGINYRSAVILEPPKRITFNPKMTPIPVLHR